MVGILQVGHRRTQYVLCQIQVIKIFFQIIVVFSKYGSRFASETCEAQVLVCWAFIYLIVDEINTANQTIPILALMSTKLEFIAIVQHPIITPSSLIPKVVHDVFIVQPTTVVFNRCGTTTFSKTR
jgi:hypothetical protein